VPKLPPAEIEIPAPAPGPMPLVAVHRALARSATRPPRDSLRGFELVRVKQKELPAPLLKKLRSSKAVELIEPVPNRWPCAVADPMINRQWGL
jgi:hypothetical protein